MTVEFPIERAPGVAPGRSSASSYGGLVWTVATALDKTLDFKGQIAASFEKIERVLAQFGTDKRYLLSVNVFLSDLGSKAEFDVAWRQWSVAIPTTGRKGPAWVRFCHPEPWWRLPLWPQSLNDRALP
ncbi:Rid family hydrolase [Sinorhizobium meliloti]|uniref:Rid family hydrolase n=1 Tax=Rhizobium meliloti TaxID=382 RepID=UPI001F479063|nr:Rid family hydrolase [Sinorhizobium meliloti]